ncbi:MAG: biopolymer transporter ExbD [Candidatus Brocadiia bacterium]
MARRAKVHEEEGIALDMTPMIDCIFLLIVFFITAGKFKRAESRLDAYLPKDIGIDQRAEPDPDKFFISVFCRTGATNPRDVIWLVNNQELFKRSDLVNKLKEIATSSGTGKKIKVSIDGDANVCFFWVISALDAAAEAGLIEIVLAPPRIPVSQWPKPLPKNIPLAKQ